METVLRLVSGAAWIYAYCRIIAVARTDKSYGMPLFAAALNLTWELLYFTGGVIYWDEYDSDTRVQTVINGCWMLLDVVIVATIVQYAYREFGTKRGALSITALIGGALTLAALLQVSVLLQFPPEEAARFSAFLQNVYMSGAFIAMTLARPDRRALRLDIGIARLVGTLSPTIFSGLIGDVRPTILILGACCFLLDGAYVLIMARSGARSRKSVRAVSP